MRAEGETGLPTRFGIISKKSKRGNSKRSKIKERLLSKASGRKFDMQKRERCVCVCARKVSVWIGKRRNERAKKRGDLRSGFV